MSMSVKYIRVFTADGSDPYRNLAAEEAMLSAVGEEDLVLFLWQNADTIVIGRNQNPWAECRVAPFLDQGGRIARRITGGGAVYHDQGNLNFSFVAQADNYDVRKQFDVILGAAKSLGIEASVSGRNDICAGERKFSGNAFYKSGISALHHGTILINGDAEKMKAYLTPNPAKLAKRSVASVASRVVNLSEISPEITVDHFKDALICSASEVYGVSAVREDLFSLPEEAFRKAWERQKSRVWIFGDSLQDFTEYRACFPEGLVSAQICFDGNTAEDAIVFTDALDVSFSSRCRSRILGKTKEELDAMGYSLWSPESDSGGTNEACPDL